MDFEEQNEIVNPQNGERIKFKKKQFWKEWRFWVYSVIALLLMLVSISSMATACAAINAGVGREEESSSFVARGKHEAFYNPDFSGYNSADHYFHNYATDFYIYFPNGYGSYTGVQWNEDNVVGAPSGASTFYFGFFARGYQYACPYEVDIYKNGLYWLSWTFEYLGDSSYTPVLHFDAGDTIWVFQHNPYYDALAESMEYFSGFNAVTANDSLVTFGAMNGFLKDYDLSDSTWTVYGYDVCRYENDSVEHFLILWFLKAPGGTWFVHLTDTLEVLAFTPAQISAASIGYWNLMSADPFPAQAYKADNWKILYVNGGVVVSVDNAYAMNNYVSFLDNGEPLDRYSQGYDDGVIDGYDNGYAVGVQVGKNSVSPDSLTTTLVTVFQQPFNQIYRFFNFNVLGLNILGLASALISVFVIIKVVKKIL